MIDTHSHLFEDEFSDDLDQCISRCKSQGVNKIVLVGFSESTNNKAMELSRKYNIFYPTAGMHPCEADDGWQKKVMLLQDFLKANKVDIIMANFTQTPERSKVVDFAKPYMKVSLGVVSKNGVITNEQAISFDESTANWGTMSHFVIYDALEAGNLLMYDTLSTPRNVEAATIVTIKANSLTLTLSNPA